MGSLVIYIAVLAGFLAFVAVTALLYGGSFWPAFILLLAIYCGVIASLVLLKFVSKWIRSRGRSQA